MVRSVVSNKDRQGNIRISQVVSPGKSGKSSRLQSPPPNKIQTVAAPSKLREGTSPQSIIGALAEEIQNDNADFLPQTADEIFASVNEDNRGLLKNSRTREEDALNGGNNIETIDFAHISDQALPSQNPTGNSDQNKLSLKEGYDQKMRKIKDGGSFQDIIEDEFSSIHKKIDGIMNKMDIDKIQIKDDVQIPEDIERASLERLNSRGIKSDIGRGGISPSPEIIEEEVEDLAERHSSPEKINELRRMDHEYAKQAYEGSYNAIFNKGKSTKPKTGKKKRKTKTKKSTKKKRKATSEIERMINNLPSVRSGVTTKKSSKKSKKSKRAKKRQTYKSPSPNLESNNLSDYEDQYPLRTSQPSNHKKKRFYNPKHVNKLYNNSLLQDMIKAKEQQMATEYKKQKELEQCTFKPKINKRSSRGFKSSIRSGRSNRSAAGGVKQFLARQERWNDMKNIRRDRLAEAKQNKELEECTFKPELQSRKFNFGSVFNPKQAIAGAIEAPSFNP